MLDLYLLTERAFSAAAKCGEAAAKVRCHGRTPFVYATNATVPYCTKRANQNLVGF